MVIGVVLNTFSDLMGIFCLLLLFLFIFSVIGINLFGGVILPEVLPTGEIYVPRAHFNSFPIAVFTTFQLMTLDLFDSVVGDTIRSYGPSSVVCSLVWMILGTLILLNLLLVIIMDAFVKE